MRLEAPAQLTYVSLDSGATIWIGSHVSYCDLALTCTQLLAPFLTCLALPYTTSSCPHLLPFPTLLYLSLLYLLLLSPTLPCYSTRPSSLLYLLHDILPCPANHTLSYPALPHPTGYDPSLFHPTLLFYVLYPTLP